MILFVVVLAVFNQSDVLLHRVYLGMSANVFQHKSRPRHPTRFPSENLLVVSVHGDCWQRLQTWLFRPMRARTLHSSPVRTTSRPRYGPKHPTPEFTVGRNHQHSHRNSEYNRSTFIASRYCVTKFSTQWRWSFSEVLGHYTPSIFLLDSPNVPLHGEAKRNAPNYRQLSPGRVTRARTVNILRHGNMQFNN